jgi:hypothetical protein
MGVVFESSALWQGFDFTASSMWEGVKRCGFASNSLGASPLNFHPPTKIAGFRYNADFCEFRAACPVGQAALTQIDD